MASFGNLNLQRSGLTNRFSCKRQVSCRVHNDSTRVSGRPNTFLRRPHVVLEAVAGGGSGSGNIAGGGSGGGGGKGDGEGSGRQDGHAGSGPLAGLLQGWRDRVNYDPEFPFKVFLEQVIGVGACVIGDMSSRPNWGLNELDFVFSTLVVGSLMNFSLMYLLAPTAAISGSVGGGFITKALSDQFLRAWGAPGANMFEPGKYNVAQRLLNFGYKGTVFSVIGFLAGITGTTLSNTLLLLRQKLDPSFVLQNTPPSVVGNAGCWALHMGISSNLRYQALGGLDQVLGGVLPLAVFRIYSTLIRAANNIVGGISFVTLARVVGVQKSADASAVVTA